MRHQGGVLYSVYREDRKVPTGHTFNKKSLVVIANPLDVAITRNGNKITSDSISITVDNLGRITFKNKKRKAASEKKRTVILFYVQMELIKEHTRLVELSLWKKTNRYMVLEQYKTASSAVEILTNLWNSLIWKTFKMLCSQ